MNREKSGETGQSCVSSVRRNIVLKLSCKDVLLLGILPLILHNLSRQRYEENENTGEQMKIDIQKIINGEESLTIRYKEPNPIVSRIIEILGREDSRLWGRTDLGSESVKLSDVLYLETVDDKVFAYTMDKVIKIDGSLYSFLNSVTDDNFFRCSKSMVINIAKVKALKSMSSNRIDAIMEGGEHILISRRYAVEFRRILKGDR